jgi:hypothetical protein
MQKIVGTLLMVLLGLGFNNDDSGNAQGQHPYMGRPTVETIHSANGIVKKIPGDEPVYIIDCPDRYLRLHTLNLPDAYKVEGLVVTVSGHIKATHTLEDDCGELFEVTAIR